jgi:MFS family permease
MLGSQISGRAYGRFPGHRIQALALLGASLCAAMVPVLHSLWFLVAVLFLLGVVQGALDVGCNTLLTWIHGKKVGPFMNGSHFFFGVGFFLAPFVFARVVLFANDIRWAYWFFSLVALPVACWLWFLPSPQIRNKALEAATRGSINGCSFLSSFSLLSMSDWRWALETGFIRFQPASIWPARPRRPT